MHMHPAALIPNVGHLKEALVEAGFPQGLLKEWLMGTGAAGGYHYPVEAVFFNKVLNVFLVVL
jgi:hypothetical protein